jgi:hypothetical protein
MNDLLRKVSGSLMTVTVVAAIGGSYFTTKYLSVNITNEALNLLQEQMSEQKNALDNAVAQQQSLVSKSLDEETVRRIVLENAVNAGNNTGLSPQAAAAALSAAINNPIIAKMNELENQVQRYERDDAKLALALTDPKVEEAIEKLKALDIGDQTLNELGKLDSVISRIDSLEVAVTAIDDVEKSDLKTEEVNQSIEKVNDNVETTEKLIQTLKDGNNLDFEVGFLETQIRDLRNDFADINVGDLTASQVATALGMSTTDELPEGNTNLYFTDQRAVDAVQATPPVADLTPIGTILCWQKDFAGTPTISDTWAEMDGSVLNDDDSPYDGQLIPDWNTNGRFLRGGLVSGVEQDDATDVNGLISDSGGAHVHTEQRPQNINVNTRQQGGNAGRNQSITTVNTGSAGDHSHTLTSTDTETRPINVSCVWIIRIK